jgi:hypothetical protein
VIVSRRWQDWITILIGALVAISPLVFTRTWTATEAWVAYVVGGVIFGVGAVSLFIEQAEYLEVVDFVLAIVLFCTPWLFGFATATGMALSAWIGAVGLFVVLATLLMREPSTSRAEYLRRGSGPVTTGPAHQQSEDGR